MLKVNGILIPTPSVFQVDLYDIDSESSARNTKGDMLRDRIAVKRKLNCEWAVLAMAEISFLLQLIKDEFFQVTYPDPMTGNIAEIRTFYVGDRQMPLLMKDDEEYLWRGLKLSFIEK